MTNFYNYNNIQTKKIKNELNKWISELHPTHFLSIQFPKQMRSSNFDISQEKLKKIMKNFERNLIRRGWHKKPLPFIATAETGEGLTWHYHILFYNCKFTMEQLLTALEKTMNYMNLPPETFNLQFITNTADDVYSYCTKETVADINGHFDSTRIILHELLLDLPVKHSKQPHIHTQDNEKDILNLFFGLCKCNTKDVF